MKVSYSWSNQPSGMKSKVPSDEYYHYGDNVIIDTTYNDKSGYKGYGDLESEWTPIHQLSLTSGWNEIAYGNGIWIAIRGTSTGTSYAYSDGTDLVHMNFEISFVLKTFPDDNSGDYSYHGLCYGAGKFVVFKTNYALYSSDGINWTSVVLPDASNECPGSYQCAYGNGVFIAISSLVNSTSHRYWTSTDAITWTSGKCAPVTMPNICYDADHNMFHIIAHHSDTQSSIISVSSTLSFRYHYDNTGSAINYLPSNGNYNGIAYGNGKLVVTSSDGSLIVYCSDIENYVGNTWSTSSIGTGLQIYNITFSGTLFVGVGFTKYITSTDGITWTNGSINSYIYNDIAYGNGMFITVSGGSGNFYYSKLSEIYYQFSGWNKSDFNITADTSVGGSWSQVSAGGGLILVN